ncbi:hypothetical protein MTO96_027073 [Rhipicephalus appendiculatus]
MPEIPPDSIVQIEENVYKVPSSLGNRMYEVRADVGLCSCFAGNQGAFCKHQVVVQRAFGGAFPNNPEVTLADCKNLGQLALGERCPPEQFYMPFAHQESAPPSPPPGTSQPVADAGASCSEPPDEAQDPPAGHSSQPEVGYAIFTTILQHTM